MIWPAGKLNMVHNLFANCRSLSFKNDTLIKFSHHIRIKEILIVLFYTTIFQEKVFEIRLK